MNQVNAVDTTTLFSLASRWQQAAGLCDTTGAAVTRAVGQLDGEWTGATATSFTDYTNTWVSAGSTLSGTLTQAARAVDQTASAVSGARNCAATRCEWLLTEARNWSTAHPNTSAAQQANAIGGLCSQTTAELGELVSAINADLATLSSTFNQLSGQENPYDAINPPLGMSMTVTHTAPTYPTATSTPAQSAQLVQAPIAAGAMPAGRTAAAAATPATSRLLAGKLTQGRLLSPSQPTSYSAAAVQSAPAPMAQPTAFVTESSGQPAPSGQVNDWIQQALAILRADGVDTSQISPADLYTIIEHESSGNPDAVNNWDSNAAAGHPSMGLMQTIDTTFNAYKLPGHDNILNPIDNIIAGVRYALARYGSISAVPGVEAVHSGGSYVGY